MTQEENIYTDHLKYVRCKSIGLIKEAAQKLWCSPNSMEHAQTIQNELNKYIQAQLELSEITDGDRYVSKTTNHAKEP